MLVVATVALPPLSPGQTNFQKHLTTTNANKASTLSSKATVPLLALLGSPQLQQILHQCCGEWANKSPQVVLAALRDYVSNAEVVHNFEALPAPLPALPVLFNLGGRGSGATCVDLELASNAPYLPNLWMVEYMNATSGICSNPSENNAEVSIFHFQSFSSIKNIIDFGKNISMPFPKTYLEAANRPVYAALNLLREDSGSGNFGSVGLVLNRRLINPMLLLSPQDTGSYECRCNSSAPSWMKARFHVNCSTWSSVNFALGSADYFDHTLLTSFSCWTNSMQHKHVGHLLSRAFAVNGTESNMTSNDQLEGYIEADVAGIISYPESVMMVIGNFQKLFGSVAGIMLQEWCMKHHWPLVWAFGRPVNATSYHGLDRIVDVKALGTSNMNRTVDISTHEKYQKIWNVTMKLRGDDDSFSPGSVTWMKLKGIVGSRLIVRALPGGRPCSTETVQCVGIDQHHDCLCSDA